MLDSDYERFFWDMDHTEGALISDLIQILSDANASSGWNQTYVGNSADVVPRLSAAASADGWGSEWSFESSDNGVFR